MILSDATWNGSSLADFQLRLRRGNGAGLDLSQASKDARTLVDNAFFDFAMSRLLLLYPGHFTLFEGVRAISLPRSLSTSFGYLGRVGICQVVPTPIGLLLFVNASASPQSGCGGAHFTGYCMNLFGASPHLRDIFSAGLLEHRSAYTAPCAPPTIIILFLLLFSLVHVHDGPCIQFCISLCVSWYKRLPMKSGASCAPYHPPQCLSPTT